MPFATLAMAPATALNPFDALLDPRAALEAHARLAAALGEKCVRWSPLDAVPARRVAEDLHRSGALDAHLRDELGLTAQGAARPHEAALASAAAFACGALAPVLVALLVSRSVAFVAVIAVTVVALALLGLVGARLGGARWPRPTARVLVAGITAMAVTAIVGRIVGSAI